MDLPPFRYARTSDDLNIAYWTLGEGEPLFCLNQFEDIEGEWEWEENRRWYAALAERNLLVKLDSRGHGLSEWSEDRRYKPADVALDIEAVAQAVGVGRYAVLAQGYSAR